MEINCRQVLHIFSLLPNDVKVVQRDLYFCQLCLENYNHNLVIKNYFFPVIFVNPQGLALQVYEELVPHIY
jgi:hypothetical protein